MRPIKLTMQAFGPYAGTETIDISELGNRTMFVISGKTGSGKTTIFDGISYAIYGKASGEDRSGSDLRSQFSRDELLTEVSLVFRLRGSRYFIKRSPQQEKKKERGDGYRIINATAELYQYDDHGELQLLAANVRDVDEKMKEIMLIDSNQFRQIVMIPQGEFRKLLTSDSKDKEVILQRLFHTELYKRIEEKLKEEAAELKRLVEQQEQTRNGLIGKITSYYQEKLGEYLAAGSVNDVLILPLLEDEISLMSQQLEILSKETKVKEKEKEYLTQKLFEAETVVKQLKTRDELGERKAFLEGQKDLFSSKEQEIVGANKAMLLAKQEELCQRLSREKQGLQQDLHARKDKLANLSALLQESELVWQQEQGREEERKLAQERIHSLQQIKEEVKSFAMLAREVNELEQEIKGVREGLQVKEGVLKKSEERLKGLLEEKERLAKTDILLLENERKLEKQELFMTVLGKYEAQLSSYGEDMKALEKRQALFHQAQASLEDGKQLVEVLEGKWFHGQAANFAVGLHHGEACPVCGSEHHPNPAVSTDGEMPHEDEIKAAKVQVSELEREKSTAESSFLQVQSRVGAKLESLQELKGELLKERPDFSDEMLEPLKNYYHEQKSLLTKEQTRLFSDRNRLSTIVDEVSRLEKQMNMNAADTEKLAEQLNELSILFTEKNTIVNGLKARIPEEMRSIQAFEIKWQEAQERQKSLQMRFEKAQANFLTVKEQVTTEDAGCQTVEKHYLAKEAELEEEKAIFLKGMREQGFPLYKDYEGAKRTEAQIQGLEQEIRHYREELRSVTDRYQELFLALKDTEVPDLEGLGEAVKLVQEQLDNLNQKYTNLLMKKRDNEDIHDSILHINREMKVFEERYRLVGELSDIARGQNGLKITFERYVLASFLDDILTEANMRLLKMTSGRYELIRKKDRAKGNAQSGLELLVFDQYTGQERHVKTLSGGESFKAALSLALGLADVVQNYAGGVSLETMFIDEGFGTLDPESLDQAIEALIDIQSSGRLVGIISHVPELKERIDARLEVTATQTGSRTEFQFLN